MNSRKMRNHAYGLIGKASRESCKSLRLNRFTLIELLVVISIITILVSLLLPALNKAREKGKSIVCTGNIKQVLFASNMYSDDYKDWFVINHNGTYYWPQNLIVRGYVKVKYDHFNPQGPFRCPSETRIANQNGILYNGWAGTHYGMNHYLGGIVATRSCRRSKISYPSQVYFLGESTCASPGAGFATSNQNIYQTLRHGTTWNVGFVDGHAGGHKGYDLSPAPNPPSPPTAPWYNWGTQ